MSAFFEERVLSVHHWTDTLFSFTCTRDPAFRFKSGQFTMIGLLVDGKPLLRAYSMVSGHWDETLEFLSIKVQDGPLTSRAAAYRGRRYGADRPQAGRHAADRKPAAGPELCTCWAPAPAWRHS